MTYIVIPIFGNLGVEPCPISGGVDHAGLFRIGVSENRWSLKIHGWFLRTGGSFGTDGLLLHVVSWNRLTGSPRTWSIGTG